MLIFSIFAQIDLDVALHSFLLKSLSLTNLELGVSVTYLTHESGILVDRGSALEISDLERKCSFISVQCLCCALII